MFILFLLFTFLVTALKLDIYRETIKIILFLFKTYFRTLFTSCLFD